MDEADLNGFVDEDCAIGLEEGVWERVELQQSDGAAADGAKSSKGGSGADAYIIEQVQKLRPRSSADYTEPRRLLPNPAMQSDDSSLRYSPSAWACAGISVLYVVWHYIPILKHAWQRMGMPGGKPPCPCCWEHKVTVGEKQLTVGECYAQLSGPEIKQLQAEGKLGKTMCNGWLGTPYRKAGIAKPELCMAYQYKCQGCPGEPAGCHS